MEIFFAIIAMLALGFCIIVIIDRAIFNYKVNTIITGMTGRQIENLTGLKVYILDVSDGGKTYYATIRSKLTIFRYRLVFFEGKLLSKIAD